MSGRIDKAGLGAAALSLAVMLTPVAALGGTLDSPGCLAGGTPATVTDVDERLDLHLADGRTLHLPGIAPPADQAEARRALAIWLTAASVRVSPVATETDRWGRIMALVFADPPGNAGHPVSVIEALIDAGLVLARPDPALQPCWPVLMRLERGAEKSRLGLWRDTPALHPDDAAGLRARAGHFAVVTGRIAMVREGRSRLYLRFAEAGSTGMAATVARPLLKRLVGADSDPHGWVGRRLRLRGLLDDRWGWQIEVTTPQQIDLQAP